MIELEDTKQISEIREHIISFTLDGKYLMTYIVKEDGSSVIEYWQSHTKTSTHANLLSNEQRMEIETFINDYKF